MNTMNSSEIETAKAIALHARLASINPLDVPVMSRDRHQPRKEQAKLARQLFKQIGLRGISVTAPNYSMAQSVDVSLPGRSDYTVKDGTGIDFANDPACKANQDAQTRIRAILLAAFPDHDDRSDSQTDYYDYRWSVS